MKKNYCYVNYSETTEFFLGIKAISRVSNDTTHDMKGNVLIAKKYCSLDANPISQLFSRIFFFHFFSVLLFLNMKCLFLSH